MDLIKLKNAPAIVCSASVVGKREHEGPLGAEFDYHDDTDRFEKESWEEAEGEMQRLAFNLALAKGKITADKLDILLAGDLINQCTPSSQGLLDYDLPYLGIFGACSTVGEGLLLAALLTGGTKGYYNRAAVVTSSHNCTAERQFRSPVEYGGQRTPTAQWTVTGAGAFIVGDRSKGPYISEVLPGRTVDRGVTDNSNMGAAMAPAAADTLVRYFKQSGNSPSDFDLIISGDLGREGHSILCELCRGEGYEISDVSTDCGLLMFDLTNQDMHAGGSGCGCAATILSAHLLPRLISGQLKDILFMPTGALMSTMSVQQSCSIPGVAHLLRITKDRI